MEISQIVSRQSLEAYLADDWMHSSRAIALRSALRTLPAIENAEPGWLANEAIVMFRALLIASLKLRDYYQDNQQAIHAALLKLNDPGFTPKVLVHGPARESAIAALTATLISDSPVTSFAGHAAEQFALYYGEMAWPVIQFDCQLLADFNERLQPLEAAAGMSSFRLWQDVLPTKWMESWTNLRSRLLEIDSNFIVWTIWFERWLPGQISAFDIPNDVNQAWDKAILRRLAEAADEDFWGKGHEYVNATLKGWLDEARANAAPPPKVVIPDVPNGQSFETVAETLLQQASPQTQITDGKLDAAPNTIFDKPQYSDNLAELPSELLAYTNTILNSLPPNCAAIVRNCFTGFRDELLVRGNRPIVNILKAMAASLTAELYDEPPADTSPDEWQLKDPREWGAGMDSMFGHFFKGYHDLIHHFPFDAEREALIATTPVDEIAASGSALTEPVDAVATLIIELGKQGFATDNIVRIVEAHQLYNRDVAQLPPPIQPSDAVTPKRRHVLQTAGFYLHTYSVLASTKELWPIFVVLAERLQVSISALLAFIG